MCIYNWIALLVVFHLHYGLLLLILKRTKITLVARSLTIAVIRQTKSHIINVQRPHQRSTAVIQREEIMSMYLRKSSKAATHGKVYCKMMIPLPTPSQIRLKYRDRRRASKPQFGRIIGNLLKFNFMQNTICWMYDTRRIWITIPRQTEVISPTGHEGDLN